MASVGAAARFARSKWLGILVGLSGIWSAGAAGALLLGCAPSRGTIGAMLVQRAGGRLYLREVPAGLGAARAGLRPGDEVLLIDGHDPRGLSEAQLHALLGGDVGEPVQLTVSRGSELLRVVVERRAIPARPRAPQTDPAR